MASDEVKRWLTAFPLVIVALACCGSATSPTIRHVPDVSYIADGLDAHRLDLYLPSVVGNVPVVVFIHGGSFMIGDRRDYADIGKALANEGIPTAVVSYRLFPVTDAQGATQDVAAACAWMIRHSADYGLDPRNMFLVGHSSGAQIAALIGTHAHYLTAAGASFAAIRGVVAAAGAYDVRDLSDEPDSWQKVDGHIYGVDQAARAKASPAVDIDPAAPPMLMACGSDDDPGSCDRAISFVAALHSAGDSDAVTIRVVGADHMGVLNSLVNPKDPLNVKLLAFLKSHSAGVDE